MLVHGIWMIGADLMLLRHRLQAAGFSCFVFRYPSLRKTPAENARRLQQFLNTLEADRVHLVAHSLGGMIALHLFEQNPDQCPGRIVLLGSPVQGSGVAHQLARHGLTRMLLGRSVKRALLGEGPGWRGDRSLGVIAGHKSMGVGQVTGGLEGPNDGTVAVSETHLPNATDHISVDVSHMGLLFSRRVADQVIWFLRKGQFRVVPDQSSQKGETLKP